MARLNRTKLNGSNFIGHLKSSIVSYPQRGPYGRWDYPGNTTGFLVEDLVKHYNAKSVLDPFAGSNTTKELCGKLDIQCDSFDLKEGFDVLSDKLPAKKYDLIFLHPPYFSMIRYSDDPRDLSNCATIGEFNRKLSDTVSRLSEYLSNDGHMVVLLGNMRKSGSYYPLGAYLEVTYRNELKEELIKLQHNTSSSYKEYSSDSFIPIAHEKVLVFARFRPITWEELVLRALDELGGTTDLKGLYRRLQNHPKRLTNPTWKATIRRTLQEEASQVNLGVWTSEET